MPKCFYDVGISVIHIYELIVFYIVAENNNRKKTREKGRDRASASQWPVGKIIFLYTI